jgi:hypothetical protein
MLTLMIILLALSPFLVKHDLCFEWLPKKQKQPKRQTDLFDQLMFKGGAKKAAAQQQAEENARQAKIQAATDTINAKFNDPLRQQTYQEVGNAARDLNLRELQKVFSQYNKQNIFGLARSGLLGGSVDAESGADLQQRFGEGKIKAEKAGLDAQAQLRTQDEKSRQNLISLAQSGIDTGTASTMAANQLSSAADVARAGANTNTLAGLFDGLTQAYLARQQGQVMQQQRPAYGGAGGNLFGAGGYAGRVS